MNHLLASAPAARIFERLLRGFGPPPALRLAACTLEFEAGGTGIYQILASRPNRGDWPVPLSRRSECATALKGSHATRS